MTEHEPSEPTRTARTGLNRRGLLTGLAGLGAGTAVAGCSTASEAPGSDPAARGTVDFHGPHQAGIATPQQNHLVFATYDLASRGRVSTNRKGLTELLRSWTEAAAAMTADKPVPGPMRNLQAPPADTGEALGLPGANLTLTVGFGPTLFDERFGLADKRPAALADLPHLAPEDLDPGRCGGDIAVQACADDPQVAFHAIRNLTRIGLGAAESRWVQFGFGRAASTGRNQSTPRNLLGFKDGTRNIHGDPETLQRWVWVGSETDQPWMRGGSYLVARRITMHIESWDRDQLADQDRVFGRKKYSGAPLTGTHEFDSPGFSEKNPDGSPTIPAGAHIRLAARENNGGTQILRRAYNFNDGLLEAGQLNAGLFMIIFQKDPRHQFVALQRKLGAHDALNEYITHVGSGLFACPPGIGHDRYWGEQLLA
jgi:deferrochelatase/peroxidase EfeB